MYQYSKNKYCQDRFYNEKGDLKTPVVIELHGFTPTTESDEYAFSIKEGNSSFDPLSLKQSVKIDNKEGKIQKDNYPPRSNIDSVQYMEEYLTSISWTNSIKPPYQFGSATFKMPLSDALFYFNGIPIMPLLEVTDLKNQTSDNFNNHGRQPSTGGWIVVRVPPVEREIIEKQLKVTDDELTALKAEYEQFKKDFLPQNAPEGDLKEKQIREEMAVAVRAEDRRFRELIAEMEGRQTGPTPHDIVQLNIVKFPACFFGLVTGISITADSESSSTQNRSYANISIQFEGFLNPLMNNDFVVSASKGRGASELIQGTIFQGFEKAGPGEFRTNGGNDFVNGFLKFFIEKAKKQNVSAADVIQSMLGLFGKSVLPKSLFLPLTKENASNDLLEYVKVKKLNEKTKSIDTENSTTTSALGVLNKSTDLLLRLGETIKVVADNKTAYGTSFQNQFLKDNSKKLSDPRNSSPYSHPVFWGPDAFSSMINGMKSQKIWSMISSLGVPDSNLVELFPILIPLTGKTEEIKEVIKTLTGEEDPLSLDNPLLNLIKCLGVIPAIVYRFKPTGYGLPVNKKVFDILHEIYTWTEPYSRSKTYCEQMNLSNEGLSVNTLARIQGDSTYNFSFKGNDSRINAVYVESVFSGSHRDGFELFGALSDPMINVNSINKFGLQLYKTRYPFIHFNNSKEAVIVEEQKVDEQVDLTPVAPNEDLVGSPQEIKEPSVVYLDSADPSYTPPEE